MIRLLARQARRDRIVLTVWVLAIAVLAAGSASTVQREFGDAPARVQVLRLALATPSLVALRGVPNGSSAGSLQFFQTFTFLAVAAGLMNTLLAVRHGRADEELGRRELLAATPVGRTAGLGATLLLGVAADLVLAVLVAAGYAAVGLGAGGAAIMGAAIGVTGLAFLGIGVLASELLPTGRAANTAGTVTVLGSYALRAAGDALGRPDVAHLTLQPAWPTFVSPIGWGELTLALTANRPAPLLLGIALAVVGAGAALIVRSRRDLGASVVVARDGPATGPRLRSPFALAWRLQRTAVLGWAIGAGLLGAVAGSLATAVARATARLPAIQRVLAGLAGRSGGTPDPAFLLVVVILGFAGMLAGAAAVQAVLRLRADEATGRLELVLAAPVSRIRWLTAAVAVGVLAVVAVLAVAGLAAWLGLLAVGDGSIAARAPGQALANLPAALVFAGLTGLVVAVLPRSSAGVAWGLFALAVVLGLFGTLLDLPAWLRHASPFADVPTVPVGDWAGVIAVAAAAVLLPMLAAAAWGRRSLAS